MAPQFSWYQLAHRNRAIPRQITRALIYKTLYGDDADHGLDDMPSIKPASSQEVIDSYASPADEERPGLDDIRKQLDALADQEHMSIDYSSEYSSENTQRSTAHPGVNTSLLKDIALGEWPSPGRSFDILEPIRGSSKWPAEESYDELRLMLQEWNAKTLLRKHGPYEKPEERDQFLLALKAHIHLLSLDLPDSAYARMESAKSLGLLREALFAFRPETEDFDDQDIYTMMAALIVNTMVADPDIKLDLEIWENVHKMMLMEAWQNRMDDSWLAEIKREKDRKIAEAQWKNDDKELRRLADERQYINKELFREVEKNVLRDLVTARGYLKQKTLDDIKDLCVWHAAHKSANEELLGLNLTMYEDCEKTETETRRVYNAQMDVLDLFCEATQATVHVLKRLGDDCWRRVRKLNADDIKDPVQKPQVLASRLADSGTAEMMCRVRAETEFIRDTSTIVLQRMSVIEQALEKLLEVRKIQFQAYECLFSSIEVEEEWRPRPDDLLQDLYKGG